jgi:hypothetical protein
MASAGGSEWLKQDRRRMLHVVYRVGDMQQRALLLLLRCVVVVVCGVLD